MLGTNNVSNIRVKRWMNDNEYVILYINSK